MEKSIAKQFEQIKSIFKEDKNFKEKVEFETQMLAFTFISEIEQLMEEKGMKRKDLAEAVGTSAGYITQLFRGNKLPNLSILAAMGIAVNKQFNIVPVDSLESARNQKQQIPESPYNLSNEFEKGNPFNDFNKLKKDCNVIKMYETNHKSKSCVNE